MALEFGTGIWAFGQFVDRYAADGYGPPRGTRDMIEIFHDNGTVENRIAIISNQHRNFIERIARANGIARIRRIIDQGQPIRDAEHMTCQSAFPREGRCGADRTDRAFRPAAPDARHDPCRSCRHR